MAMLRGMGWQPGQAASRSGRGAIEAHVPASRPSLLGIGAKPMTEALGTGNDSKGKTGGKPPPRTSKRDEMRFVPLMKRERELDSGGSRAGSADPSVRDNSLLALHSRDPSFTDEEKPRMQRRYLDSASSSRRPSRSPPPSSSRHSSRRPSPSSSHRHSSRDEDRRSSRDERDRRRYADERSSQHSRDDRDSRRSRGEDDRRSRHGEDEGYSRRRADDRNSRRAPSSREAEAREEGGYSRRARDDEPRRKRSASPGDSRRRDR